MTDKMQVAARWVLWGSHPRYAGGLRIKIAGGSLPQVRREAAWRKAGGFTDLGIVRGES